MTGDKKYLDTAIALLNSFFVDAKAGGVTYKTREALPAFVMIFLATIIHIMIFFTL